MVRFGAEFGRSVKEIQSARNAKGIGETPEFRSSVPVYIGVKSKQNLRRASGGVHTTGSQNSGVSPITLASRQSPDLVAREAEFSAEDFFVVLAEGRGRCGLESFGPAGESHGQVRVAGHARDGVLEGLEESATLELIVGKEEVGIPPG